MAQDKKMEYHFNKKSGTITGYTKQNVTYLQVPSKIADVPVKSIANMTFSNFSRLEKVIIPDNVTFIGPAAFFHCFRLKNIFLSENKSFSSIDGILFSKKQDVLITYPAGKTQNIYEIPNTVSRIAEMAFFNSRLAKIIIPTSVTSIGEAAFSSSSNLIEIHMPNNITIIGKSAFYDCTELKEIFIPNNVTSIKAETFYNCKNLIDVTIPSSVTSIGEQAFACCSSLTEIIIPNSVMSIGNSAFAGCSNLVEITIPNSVTKMGNSVFLNTNLETIHYSGSTEEWNALNVNIPDSTIVNFA